MTETEALTEGGTQQAQRFANQEPHTSNPATGGKGVGFAPRERLGNTRGVRLPKRPRIREQQELVEAIHGHTDPR
jgi:hypothetical protein